MYEDPNSVDINSEEFASLPAEMKHEILKEMKEFCKRRRTMIHKPPEVRARLIYVLTFHSQLSSVCLLLAIRRLFSVPAGRPAAEEPAEPASGGRRTRDEPA